MGKRTFVAIVLDRSGSMEVIRAETVAGFNECIREVHENAEGAGETRVTLCTFNGKVGFDFVNEDPDRLADLTEKTYTPAGSTALNDAIGFTLDKLQAKVKDDDETAYLVAIITDGGENASQEYSRQAISDRIEKLQQTGRWTFTFLGANQDVLKTSRDLNIPVGNAASFSARGGQHTSLALRAHSSAIGGYMRARGKGAMCSVGVYDDTGGAPRDLSFDPLPDAEALKKMLKGKTTTTAKSADGKGEGV